MYMKQLNLINEPSIGWVTLPSGETATWFYNPDTTEIARYATKVVFRSAENEQEYIYILLLPENNIDDDSTCKSWSIAQDLGSVDGKLYQPSFSKLIYSLKDFDIKK
ncbi:hypothetical protein VHP8226_01210 [Vibrio hippocampi]|uniref:Uncharacterized protein n=2 Tax=Vibrio hippocampi TaxID=654686 RepID=A0ABM8ZH27_9VIBR|nr:hypothetical protein VHP8226_01210 [Vibrio hippocampi]